jgi:ferrochelatase
MKADGVSKAVLLPLYPQYSKTTTGASLVFWKALEEEGVVPGVPTTSVFEYTAHPDLVQAFNDRIDEGLQRFPADVRGDVHLLFSAHGTPLYEMKRRKDPYCCLVHSTVQHIMSERSHAQPFRVAFQSKVGPAEWLTPATPDALAKMATEGVQHVLVVPVAFVSDHVETAFELDMEVRHEAEEAGIRQYEVMTGLNDHPLFVRALSDMVRRHLGLAGESPPETKYSRKSRKLACHQCIRNAEAFCWTR